MVMLPNGLSLPRSTASSTPFPIPGGRKSSYGTRFKTGAVVVFQAAVVSKRVIGESTARHIGAPVQRRCDWDSDFNVATLYVREA